MIGDIEDDIGGIAQRFRQHDPGIAMGALRLFEKLAQSELRAAVLRRPVPGAIVAASEIDGFNDCLAGLLDATVEASLALATGVAGFDHPRDQRRNLADLLKGIVGRQICHQAAADMRHQVEAHEIQQTEHPGLGDADGRAERGIGLLHVEPAGNGLGHGALQPEAADAVGDEARLIPAGHDALAQPEIAEAADGSDSFRTRLRAGHDLQQPHIARRVEEVGDQEVLGEFRGQALGQLMERNRRRVGRQDRARPTEFLKTAVDRVLGRDVFDNSLDDPVDIGQPSEVILDVAGRQQPGVLRMHEGRRLGRAQRGERTLGQRVAIDGPRGNDVEQQHGHARIGHVGGDTATHDAGADDGNLANVDHWTASSTVAMPCPPPMHMVARA
jgi:hypothetical protein